MNILIVGCNGLLGQSLIQSRPSGPEWKVFGAGLDDAPILPEGLAGYHSVDISQRPALEAVMRTVSPDWIFNAAAVTDVDLCERDPALASLINRDTVGWMAASGVPMAHVSSDYVFDGIAGPYREEDRTAPLSHYGSTKLESEALALSQSRRSLVVRTMLLWGKGKGGKTSFVDFVRGSLLAGKTIRIVTDQIGNPTLAEDLALSIWKLVQGGRSGLYHVAGSERNSRFEWAQAIAEHYSMDAGLIQPCLTSDLKQAARRPLESGLLCDKLERDTGFRPRGVAGQLARVDELALKG